MQRIPVLVRSLPKYWNMRLHFLLLHWRFQSRPSPKAIELAGSSLVQITSSGTLLRSFVRLHKKPSCYDNHDAVQHALAYTRNSHPKPRGDVYDRFGEAISE